MPRMRIGSLDLSVEIAGSGEPVLMLMGLGGEHHAWDLVRDDLARRHRLVLVDNRDAGQSDEATAPYGLGDMAGDALGVMDRLEIERFHVVGASMGGAIAQHLALQAPPRVATLGLVSTWARTDGFLAAVLGSWRRAIEHASPEEFLASVLPWSFTHRYFREPPAELSSWQAAARERGLVKSVDAYRRQVDACLAHDVMGLLPLLRTPTLVLAGEDDILTPPRYGRAIAAAIVTAELQLVPASGHACFLESPKAVGERLLRFLDRHRLAT